MRERCPLAVWAVMPAVSASSDAVWARPSISSDSMDARAGSPIRAATSERALTVVMPEIYARAREAARVNGSVNAEPLPRPLISSPARRGRMRKRDDDEALRLRLVPQAQLQRDLVVGDLVVTDASANVDHLEPFEIAQ